MSVAALLLLAIVPNGERAASDHSISAKPICTNVQKHRIDRTAPVRPEPLSRQPAADQYIAVVRTIDGCEKPIVVREDVR